MHNDTDKPVKLIDKPRKWQSIRVGASSDARWRGLHYTTLVIDSTRVHEIQQQKRSKK